ncbi:MAG: hypothetical protein HW407_380 [Bacteroidetes bacterium]|nr:hypothetical protein [Bacteroidota bacterium]
MRRLAFACVIVLGLPVMASGQDRGVGLGVIIGEPTGLSAKFWTSSRNAIDVAVAYSFRRSGYFHVHADYLWHFPNVIQSTERFPLYAGIGGRIGVGRGSGIFGIRIAGGIAYWAKNAPIEIFFEVAPIVDLAPETGVSGNVGIGARYYFN